MSVLLHGVVTVPTGGWSITIQLAGSPLRSVTVPAGQYLWDTLSTALETLIQASGAELATMTLRLNGSTNLHTGQAPGPGNTTITWTSTAIRDVLGWTGATTVFVGSTVQAATYPPSAYLPLALEAEADLPKPQELRSEAYSDSTQYVVHYGRKLWREVRLKFTGTPRASSVDEYMRVDRFWSYVFAKGEPFRYYPRASVTGAYVPLTTPYGYQWYTHATPRDLDPAQVVPGLYALWTISCRWHPSAGI